MIEKVCSGSCYVFGKKFFDRVQKCYSVSLTIVISEEVIHLHIFDVSTYIHFGNIFLFTEIWACGNTYLFCYRTLHRKA